MAFVLFSMLVTLNGETEGADLSWNFRVLLPRLPVSLSSLTVMVSMKEKTEK